MIRMGTGFDAHRLVAGRQLILGGVSIPCERGLAGHSDADVLCHALIDALLGAAADGDIGQHFPDSDPKWKGADSLELLTATVVRLAGKGFRVGNVDVTVVAEAPRLAPHIGEMRQRVAAAMGVDVERVSVKATTVEGMGALGRGEGLSAMAVAVIESEEA